MHVGRKAQKREKKAMSVSLYGNLFFVIVEIVMAIYTSSQAVLLDAIYDGVEFCMLLPSLFLIPLLYKPSNEKHPFGYMQIESMFVVVKGITMTGVTVGLILNHGKGSRTGRKKAIAIPKEAILSISQPSISIVIIGESIRRFLYLR